MTEKAGQVASDILLEIVVLGAEASLEASELQSTLRYINRWMTQLSAMGVNLGYTKVDSINDDITIPDGAVLGLIKNVALMIAPQYGAIVTAELAEAARDGLKAMRKLGVNIEQTRLPDTLPIGSGNESYTGSYSHFFAGELDQIISESSQNILIESNTLNASSGDSNGN